MREVILVIFLGLIVGLSLSCVYWLWLFPKTKKGRNSHRILYSNCSDSWESIHKSASDLNLDSEIDIGLNSKPWGISDYYYNAEFNLKNKSKDI